MCPQGERERERERKREKTRELSQGHAAVSGGELPERINVHMLLGVTLTSVSSFS